ncbi:hypothetical protein Cni_G01439 [Canna indica]|uniref:Uncharacterized protein n=1 Tax=Canna indica TaxID=4628 RepID=A0AAQ3JMM7_9LILI|nr:hypothetical protein Cni_G01439 [Canna indica]
MKCKLHPYEPGAGVCASCLRERLLALVDAESGFAPERHRRRRSEDLPPVAFPRSVSPYRTGASHRLHLRFFSTPQIGPTFVGEVDSGQRRSSGRFSVFKVLFGHRRSEKAEQNCRSGEGSGRSSWLSALVRRKKKQPQIFSAAEQGRRSCRPVERGMSPAMEDGEEDVSGYSSESSSGWRRPTPTPLRRAFASGRSHHHQHQGSFGSVSGFSVCLSPLVKAAASGRRSQVSEAGGYRGSQFSGDLRSPAISVHRHRSTATGTGSLGLGPSRSRKLADFGRFK